MFLPPSSLRFSFFVLLAVTILSACLPGRPPDTIELVPFSSDGCSLFPDSTLNGRISWCECCQSHDLTYWQGGSMDERRQADLNLRACVLARSADSLLAETIYLGVRAGGAPAFPTWYRWGYGWPYGRGYQSLSAAERLQVEERLATYRQDHPAGYCKERAQGSEK